jgi:hypothetical protein
VTTLFVERRRPALAPELLVRVGLAWAMICALMLVTNLREIAAWRFPDPDDMLRLVQVRDLLAGQGWFDLTQHRIDTIGGGVPMHWSRLVDLPLAGMMLLLRPLLGASLAEGVTVVVVPLITFGCALLLAGRIVWRLVGEEAAGLACLAMALSVPVVSQMRPLRIDHHGWQIVCALAAVNGLMARNPRHGGWFTGASLAVWLAISIEGLPMAAAICGIVALRWLRNRHDAAWFTATMQGLAVGSGALFLATRGLGDLVQHCDAVSPFHLAIFAAGAIAATGLAALEPLPRPALLGGLALIAALGAGLLFGLAPQCAAGGFAQLDPLVMRFWYEGVGEGLPVWHQPPGLALQIVVPPLIGLFACVQLAGRTSDWLRRFWIDYTLLLLAALGLSVVLARAGAVAGALAAVPLGWQIREWIRNARTMRKPSRRALALAGMGIALLPALPLTVLAFAMPAEAAIGGGQARVSSCAIDRAAPALRDLPKGEILAPLDIGPSLLSVTDDTVVATGHHRGQRPMHTVIATFLGTPEAAHATFAARGTAYLVLCPDLAEPARYVDAAPGGFMAQLLEGRAPQWLEPVAAPGAGNLEIWRVRR